MGSLVLGIAGVVRTHCTSRCSLTIMSLSVTDSIRARMSFGLDVIKAISSRQALQGAVGHGFRLVAKSCQSSSLRDCGERKLWWVFGVAVEAIRVDLTATKTLPPRSCLTLVV